MRSTRVTDPSLSWGMTVLALACASCIEPPDGPRYMGAGSDTPQYGGTLVFQHESDVRTLDPHMGFDELSNIAIKLMFDGLLDYDTHAKLIPSLAAKMPEVSADGKTFVFTLREGVRFHHGRELVADDVRWSLERMLHPDFGSPGFSYFVLLDGIDAYRNKKTDHIRGIEVLDRYRIAFRLTKADQTFLNSVAMTFAYPVPKEFYGGGHNMSRSAVGTGAYVFERWEKGDRLVFKRNRRYFRPGRPYVERMVFLMNLAREPAIMRFRNGELDMAHRFSPADYLFFRSSRKWRPYRSETPQVNLWGIVLNCGMPPFDNRHVRRAVAFAIDRQRWRKARNFRLQITGQPIPPPLLGHDANAATEQRYDLAQAKKEMALAGLSNGLKEPVELWLGEGETARVYGELAQADLARIGIKIRLKQVAFSVFLEETGQPRRAQSVLSGWSQDYPDPSSFLNPLFHSASIHEHDSENRSFYRNPKLDALLDHGRVEPNRSKRFEIYKQASQILIDDAPWAFIWHDLQLEAWQPYVKGYTPHPVWSEFYRDVWLDLPRRRIAEKLRRATSWRIAGLNPWGARR